MLLCKRIPESRLYLFLTVKTNLKPPKKVISYLNVVSLCSLRTMYVTEFPDNKNFKNLRDTYVKLSDFNNKQLKPKPLTAICCFMKILLTQHILTNN